MYLFRNKFVALLLVITPKSFWPMKKLSSLFSLFLLIPLFAVASEVGDRTIPAEVAQLADSLKQKFAPDKRVALFDVDYSFSGKNVMLRGVTTSAEAKTALLDGLAKKGYAVMDCLQVLPDEAGLEGKTYGIVNVSVCTASWTQEYFLSFGKDCSYGPESLHRILRQTAGGTSERQHTLSDVLRNHDRPVLPHNQLQDSQCHPQ